MAKEQEAAHAEAAPESAHVAVAEPVVVEPSKSPEEEEAYVTVTHGYGKVRSTDKHQIDGHWFHNGIARTVPIDLAKAWKKLPFGKSFMIHPSDATEVQIAQRCGVQPMKPEKLAVQLAGSDLHSVAAEMDPETLERIILDLASHLPSTHPLRPRTNRR